jgi:hypothetical protein
MSKLILSPEDASALADVKPGDECSVELSLKITKNDETGLQAQVTSVEYEEAEPEAEGEGEGDMVEHGDKKGHGNPALMIIMGKKK